MTAWTARDLMAYVDGQIDRLGTLVDRLSDQLDKHEDYHRETLENELATVKAARWNAWSTIVALITALASVVAVIVTLAGHG